MTQSAKIQSAVSAGKLMAAAGTNIVAFYRTVTATETGTSVTAAGGSSYQASVAIAFAFENPSGPTNSPPNLDSRWAQVTSLSAMLDELIGSAAGTSLAANPVV